MLSYHMGQYHVQYFHKHYTKTYLCLYQETIIVFNASEHFFSISKYVSMRNKMKAVN